MPNAKNYNGTTDGRTEDVQSWEQTCVVSRLSRGSRSSPLKGRGVPPMSASRLSLYRSDFKNLQATKLAFSMYILYAYKNTIHTYTHKINKINPSGRKTRSDCHQFFPALSLDNICGKFQLMTVKDTPPASVEIERTPNRPLAFSRTDNEFCSKP